MTAFAWSGRLIVTSSTPRLAALEAQVLVAIEPVVTRCHVKPSLGIGDLRLVPHERTGGDVERLRE